MPHVDFKWHLLATRWKKYSRLNGSYLVWTKTPSLRAVLGASKHPPQCNLNSISGEEKFKLSTSHSSRIKGEKTHKNLCHNSSQQLYFQWHSRKTSWKTSYKSNIKRKEVIRVLKRPFIKRQVHYWGHAASWMWGELREFLTRVEALMGSKTLTVCRHLCFHSKPQHFSFKSLNEWKEILCSLPCFYYYQNIFLNSACDFTVFIWDYFLVRLLH